VIVETGTWSGGSALYLAMLFDLVGSGRVITVDVAAERTPEHPRITYLTGSSTDSATLDAVRERIEPDEKVMVSLDSDHRAAHVLGELRTYADLVTSGQYLIVEDTNVNGHPVYPEHGPGPHEAVERFLAEDRRFERDRSREKLLLTFNPGGYLIRTG